MTRDISITITSYTNGDGVRIYYGWKSVLDEVHEERMQSLKAVEKWLCNQIHDELQRRLQYAGHS
jgi:hypothetical protein